MIRAAYLKAIYERNVSTIKKNLEGISNEESRINPQPAGNNINWTLGHIVASRNYTLDRLLQAGALWDEAAAAPYIRGSESLPADKGMNLEDLLAVLEASRASFATALDAVSEERLATELKTGTVAERLEFMAWHEGYHAGQLGLLRRLVGKDGAI